jgi:hypothetical protein
MKKITGIFFALIMCSVAHAESYIGINLTSVEIEADGVDGPSPQMIMGKIGSSISPKIAGEYRVGFGDGSDEFNGVDFKINHMFGAYMKIHSSEGATKPYFILGITKGKLTLSESSESDSEDDISYGLGVDFSNGLNLEYMQYMDKDGVELNGLSVGFIF